MRRYQLSANLEVALWLTLQAVVGCYLMHHLFVFSLAKTVRAIWVEEVMRHAVTGISVESCNT